MKKQLIYTLIIFLITSGCNTSYQSQNSGLIASLEKSKNDIAINAKSFEGQDKSMLLRAWGAPKSTSSDGKTGEIYHYANSINLSAGKYIVFINMFVSNEGKIYGSDVKHLLQ